MSLPVDRFSTTKAGDSSKAHGSTPLSLIATLVPVPNPLQSYLRYHNPSLENEGCVCPIVMETYMKSCAGYSVITYVLGAYGCSVV